MIKVLLVDDHDLVRAGIVRLLDDVVDLEVVGECATGEEAIGLCQSNPPDVVLMDLHMPGIGGMEAAKRIVDRHKDIKVIILTAASETPMSKHLFKIGISGFLTKGTGVDEMVTAIKRARAGQRYISPSVAQNMAFALMRADTSPIESLSRRELEVLLKISEGFKNKEIAEQLSLSPKTTSTYRARLLEKLNVSNDVELTKLSIQYGLNAELIQMTDK